MSSNLNFHLTFPPTAEYIIRLLEVCDSGEFLSKEEISERTGIPTGKNSGKVEPHIFYSEYMGLLENHREGGKHQLMLTPLGRELLRQDSGMQEKISVAVCHSRISSKFGGADLWVAMIKNILPKYPRGLNSLLMNDELSKLFNSNVRTGPFFSSYSGLFNKLDLVNKDGENVFLNASSIDKELVYVYAYSLFYEWEGTYPSQRELTADEVAGLRIAETFGLNDKSFYSVLELMSEKNLIRFNRQLSPFTVLKLCQAKEMIPVLYDELC